MCRVIGFIYNRYLVSDIAKTVSACIFTVIFSIIVKRRR